MRLKSSFWLPYLPAAYVDDLTAANLSLGYTLGLIAANGICLPSFYFYNLLAGVKITMLGVTSHAVKGMAAGAVALIGLLPIYVAIALTSIVFPLGSEWNAQCALLGLVLPFLAGISGAVNLYEGFVGLADTMTCRDRTTRAFQPRRRRRGHGTSLPHPDRGGRRRRRCGQPRGSRGVVRSARRDRALRERSRLRRSILSGDRASCAARFGRYGGAASACAFAGRGVDECGAQRGTGGVAL